VGDKIEVIFDSGIRTGIDIMKAMAMGAKGTMVGRAYIYGLGAGGEAGVTRALEVLKAELDVTMGLCGEKDITKVGRHNLMLPQPAFTIPAPARAPAKPRSARR
jgi:L-lactate dehydrogenase (cytochrome)